MFIGPEFYGVSYEPIAQRLPLNGFYIVCKVYFIHSFVVVQKRTEVHQTKLKICIVGADLDSVFELIHHNVWNF